MKGLFLGCFGYRFGVYVLLKHPSLPQTSVITSTMIWHRVLFLFRLLRVDETNKFWLAKLLLSLSADVCVTCNNRANCSLLLIGFCVAVFPAAFRSPCNYFLMTPGFSHVFSSVVLKQVASSCQVHLSRDNYFDTCVTLNRQSLLRPCIIVVLWHWRLRVLPKQCQCTL